MTYKNYVKVGGGGGGGEEGLKATMPTSLLSAPDPQIEHQKYRSHSKGFPDC